MHIAKKMKKNNLLSLAKVRYHIYNHYELTKNQLLVLDVTY